MPPLPPSGTVFHMTHRYRHLRRQDGPSRVVPVGATATTLAHANKKKHHRRKAREHRMEPVFVMPQLPTQGVVHHASAVERAVEAPALVEARLPHEDEFIPFGPSDEYDYYTPRPKLVKSVRPPDAGKQREYAKWNELLPKLVDPIFRYSASAFGSASATSPAPVPLEGNGDGAEGDCAGSTCLAGARVHRVVAVFLKHCEVLEVPFCDHSSVVLKLAERGLFSSSPFVPGYAYSIDLLNIFVDLMRNGANSIESLAASLHQQHRANGYGLPIQEGFRRTLGHAIQWYDQVRARQEVIVEERIASARVQVLYPAVSPANVAAAALPSGPPTRTIETPPATPRRHVPFPTIEDVEEDDGMDTQPDFAIGADEREELLPSPERPPWHPPPPFDHRGMRQGSVRSPEQLGRESLGAARHWIEVAAKYGLFPEGRKDIHQYLVGKCPTCFATETTGRPLSECDFHFAVDACFGHRHNVKASACPWIAYDSRAMLPKEFVDAVGAAHNECRKGTAREYHSAIPPAAVKACESSHTAADGSRIKAGGEKHDDRAVGAIVCRHDVPLFICNIDTPGEQLKYALALLIWTSLHLPDNATILGLYDIGCVAHKTVQSYEILTPELEARIAFATSAMHAYAHQWECQIVYSPRLNPSHGLSDGEGCERLWSRIRKLISNLRAAARQVRLITLDRHAQFVASSIRDDLGHWLGRKWEALKQREFDARKEIALSGHTAEFLRAQWESQREAQLEVRRMTAPRLRKELEAVMALQDQIEAVQESIVAAQTAIDNSRTQPTEGAREHLDNLRITLAQLTRQAEDLYASLKVEQAFPAIQEFGVDFVRTLVMCYDAKCIARRKLTGRFFEWDHLDQAVGGSGEALGTKQHQRVLQSIQRRTPAIHNAIARYNTYCARLRELAPAGRSYPLPQELNTDIAKLRNDPALLEDVWVSHIPAGTARWLTDSSVRAAIRAQLSLDRCAVERERLKREESQLLNWLTLESKAVAAAIYDARNTMYVPALKHAYARLEDIALACKKVHTPWARWLEVVRTPMVEAEARAAAAEGIHVGRAGRFPDSLTQRLEAAAPSGRIAVQGPIGIQTPPTTPRRYRPPCMSRTEVPGEEETPSDVEEGTLDQDDPFLDDEALGPLHDDSGEEQTPVIFRTPKAIKESQGDAVLARVVASWESVIPPTPVADLYRAAQDGFTHLEVSKAELNGLRHPVELNASVVYTALAALFAELCTNEEQRNRVAVFPPRAYTEWKDLGQIRPVLKLVEISSFWNKQVVLIPIYESGHWSLAIIYPHLAKIDFYDSLGDTRRWEVQAHAVGAFMTTLLDAARQVRSRNVWPRPPSWETRPLVIESAPHQCLSLSDSGLWVTVCAAAVMRRWRTTLFPEGRLIRYRFYLYELILRHVPAAPSPSSSH